MPTMWDRLKTAPHRAGSPLDDDRMRAGYIVGLGGNNNAATPRGGYSYSIKGGPPPPRPPREFLQSQLETSSAPAVQEPPPRNPNRLALRTNLRPASAIYTQFPAAPAASHSTNLATKYNHRYGAADDISPPSSPEPDSGGAYRYQGDDVSPIEDDPPETSQFEPGSSRNRKANRMSVQEARQAPPPQSKAATNIPMIRRARRQQSDAALRDALIKDRPPSRQQQHQHQQHQQQQQQVQNQPAQDGPRWDPITGERTTAAHGRPSQVKPAAFAQGLGVMSQSPAPTQRSPSAVVTSFGDRVRRMTKKGGGKELDADPAAGVFASSRPGWRGASGRTTIVDPVRDNPAVAPLRIPDKSNRRVVSPSFAPGPKSAVVAPRRGQTPPVSPPGSETATGTGPRGATVRQVVPSSQLSPPPSTSSPSHGDGNFPSPPLSGNPVGGDAPALAAKELARDGLAKFPSSPLSPKSTLGSHEKNAIRRKPPPAHVKAHHQQDSISSVYSQLAEASPTPPLHNPNANSLAPSNDTWVPPPSRFSVTTYATSATGTSRDSIDDQDRDRDRPPMPTLPPGLKEKENIMTEQAERENIPSPRNSPLAASPQELVASPVVGESQAGWAQKAPGSGGVAPNPSVLRAQQVTERPTSASSMNKMLPPAPPETSAGEARDRVGMLNAQLKALANRQMNINRSITQMTELMPTDNLMNSDAVRRKREMEKRKVEALKQELSEVRREEYELGLKLHMAYKRLDRDADYEPTTLWVRRVTG